MINDNPVVLYHDQCADGFTAAWVAHKAMAGRSPVFIPVQYGSPPPREAYSGRVVYILDFSYDAATLEHIISLANAVVVLDHHKTAKDDLTGLIKKYHGRQSVDIHFDLAKSGGRLAWEHFHRREVASPPKLVTYTEDRDLWTWALPHSREVSAWLASYPRTFEAWDEADFLLSSPGGEVTAALEGRAVLRYQDRVADNHVKNAVEIELFGHKVLSCNCTTLISEVTGNLAKDRPFAATWFVRADGKKVWSLRSGPNGLDVSKLAKSKGGGGHPHAAGFEE